MADEKKSTVTVDISKWKMRDRFQFNKLVNSSDEATADLLREKGVVTAWPFAGSPADKAAWEDLELEDFAAIVLAVTNASQERFRRGL